MASVETVAVAGYREHPCRAAPLKGPIPERHRGASCPTRSRSCARNTASLEHCAQEGSDRPDRGRVNRGSIERARIGSRGGLPTWRRWRAVFSSNGTDTSFSWALRCCGCDVRSRRAKVCTSRSTGRDPLHLSHNEHVIDCRSEVSIVAEHVELKPQPKKLDDDGKDVSRVPRRARSWFPTGRSRRKPSSRKRRASNHGGGRRGGRSRHDGPPAACRPSGYARPRIKPGIQY